MRLGYHTSGLQNHRLLDALDLLAAHHYEAVAITPDTCHLDPETTTMAACRELGARLRELDLTPTIETGARYLLDPRHKHEPTLMTPGAAARERRLDFYRRVAAMGRELGARVVSFWTGIDRAPGPDSGERLLHGVRAACAAIRDEGMEPSLEPEPGMAVETFADWLRLREQLGPEAPSLTLDVGHLYAVWEGEPAAVVASAAPFLSQVHLEDMRRGVHEHLVPGTGEVDFAAVLAALSDSGYGGPVCFELSRSSHAAPTTVAACRNLWLAHRGDSRR